MYSFNSVNTEHLQFTGHVSATRNGHVSATRNEVKQRQCPHGTPAFYVSETYKQIK